VEVRVQLESGRLENSSGDKESAKTYFAKALELATKSKFDFYAVDAAHMLGIVTKGEESLKWNEQAIQMAAASQDKRAQNWQGSLLNNTAWTYHDMGKFDEALVKFQGALEFHRKGGNSEKLRIAKWSVARCLRSLKRYDEALRIQRELETGPTDGYVWEEIAELLLVTGKVEEAKPYFRKAYDTLSADDWLKKNESKRLERLKSLSG
jgi:tetratricopeptide (TPR) repeat protein